MKDTTELSLPEITELRRREKMKHLTDTDVVRAYYYADDAEHWTLTARQETIRQRWDFVKAQFLKRHRYQHICETMVKEFGIGIATARRDVTNAMQLFGEIDKVPKEAHRLRAIDMALEAFHVAKVNQDPVGMTKATNSYMIAAGLDKDDPDQVDIEKMMSQRTYVEVLDPALRELMLNFMEQSGGAVDVTKLFELMYASKNAEYVEYEHVSNNTGADQGGD